MADSIVSWPLSTQVLLAHPGTQYSARLAQQLFRHGCLHRFWTGLALPEQSFLESAVRRWRKSPPIWLGNRIVDQVPADKIRTAPLIEATALLRVKMGAQSEAVFHERNVRFQRAIPNSEMEQCSVVVGFDTSSWILAQRARAIGKRFILDQTIGHPAVKERGFGRLRQRYPSWSSSVPEKSSSHVALEREEHALANLIVVPSHYVKSTLTEEGVDESKIKVIPFGTDLELFTPAEPSIEMESSDEVVTFLFVGALTARKGVPVLLAAWTDFAPKNAELWLVGSGTIPPEESQRLPTSVRVMGAKSRTDVAQLMRQADAFVFPSFFEGLAQVQIEALASGLPVIATRESGAEDIVKEGETGFVLPAGDVEALVVCLRRFTEDASLRTRMRHFVLSSRDELGWQVYGDRWAELLAAVDSR